MKVVMWNRRNRWKALALNGQKASRRRGDRRAVEARTEERPDPPGAAEACLCGAIQNLDERLGVVLIPLVARGLCVCRMPVPPALDAALSDAQGVSRRKAFDAGKD